ncbi:MAG: AmmeMemoRadiSam system protein A [Pseudomonadota bacterium]
MPLPQDSQPSLSALQTAHEPESHLPPKQQTASISIGASLMDALKQQYKAHQSAQHLPNSDQTTTQNSLAQHQDKIPSVNPAIGYLSVGVDEAIMSIIGGLQSQFPKHIDLTRFPKPLRQNAASFVTLEKNNKLRGCIGSVEAHRPLISDIIANAIGAAFHDTRFSPLEVEETQDLTLSLSVLSTMKPFNIEGKWQDQILIKALRPNIDGLMIKVAQKRAIYLPQVWEMMGNGETFLANLKHKAGLDPMREYPDMQAWTYHVDKTLPKPFPILKRR